MLPSNSNDENFAPLTNPSDSFIKLHNWIIDVAMPSLNANSFKVFMYLYRNTVGYKTEWTTASYALIMKGTGIVGMDTMRRAITELSQRDFIQTNASGKIRQTVSYRINAEFQPYKTAINPTPYYENHSVKADKSTKKTLSRTPEIIASNEPETLPDTMEIIASHYGNHSTMKTGVLWKSKCHTMEIIASEPFDTMKIIDSKRHGEKDNNKDRENIHTQTAVELEIFDYWSLVMESPKSKFTEDRRRKIRARLDEGYTVSDIKLAIDGCAKTDFNMGRQPGQTKLYNGLDLICRNGSKLEQFIRYAKPSEKENQYANGHQNGNGKSASRSVAALYATAERHERERAAEAAACGNDDPYGAGRLFNAPDGR